MPLAGSVVVITGASSGIGRASALAFAGHGARLVLSSRSEEALDRLAGRCRPLGAEVVTVPLDVSHGVLITASSLLALIPNPLVPSYVMSKAAVALSSGTVHVAEDIDELTVTSSEIAGAGARQALPPDRSAELHRPTRQPAGKETAWAYTHVPRSIRGDAAEGVIGTWDEADIDVFCSRVEARIEELAPGFTDLIRGRFVQTPPSLERENANLHRGAINGGTAQLHQQLVFRPVPGLGRPGTPVRSLFLASGSAHPGGGVHGAPGKNAVRAAVAADRRRLGPLRRSMRQPR